jgi:hypothetical protein
MRIIPAALALSLCACNYSVKDIASVPDNPTYTQDVRYLLADHCLVCHGFPPNRGAPASFRLDVYADTNGVPGAQSMAGSVLNDAKSGRMPPGVPSNEQVGPNGVAMLQKWVDNGAPE